jgi:hypothetical protein
MWLKVETVCGSQHPHPQRRPRIRRTVNGQEIPNHQPELLQNGCKQNFSTNTMSKSPSHKALTANWLHPESATGVEPVTSSFLGLRNDKDPKEVVRESDVNKMECSC